MPRRRSEERRARRRARPEPADLAESSMFDNRKTVNRKLRQGRVRDRVRGTAARPRLCVFRSAKHIYVQVISDAEGKTLVAASTLSTDVRAGAPKKTEAAKKVGELVAKRCLEQSIS